MSVNEFEKEIQQGFAYHAKDLPMNLDKFLSNINDGQFLRRKQASSKYMKNPACSATDDHQFETSLANEHKNPTEAFE